MIYSGSDQDYDSEEMKRRRDGRWGKERHETGEEREKVGHQLWVKMACPVRMFSHLTL